MRTVLAAALSLGFAAATLAGGASAATPYGMDKNGPKNSTTPDLPLVDAIGKELALAREIAPEDPRLAAFEAELRQFTMPE